MKNQTFKNKYESCIICGDKIDIEDDCGVYIKDNYICSYCVGNENEDDLYELLSKLLPNISIHPVTTYHIYQDGDYVGNTCDLLFYEILELLKDYDDRIMIL